MGKRAGHHIRKAIDLVSPFSRRRYALSRDSRRLGGAIRASPLPEGARRYFEACAWAGNYAILLLPAQPVYRGSELAEELRAALRTPDGRAQAQRVATWAVLAEGYGAGGPGWEANLARARQVLPLGDREWPIVHDLARPFAEQAASDGAGRLIRFSEISLDWLCEAASGRPFRPRGDTRFWLIDEYARLYFAWRQVLLAALGERRRRLALLGKKL